MAKQLKRTRANKPQPKGDSGYGQRKNMPWSQRHEHHELVVFACPCCKPHMSPLLGGGVRPGWALRPAVEGAS